MVFTTEGFLEVGIESLPRYFPKKTNKHGWGKLVYVRDGTVSERLGTSMGKHLKCI